MKLVKEHEYKKLFDWLQPHCLTAPFGLTWYNPQEKCLVITSKDYTKNFENKNFKIKTYENLHAKIAIGINGLLVGSWNWSLSHETASKHREIVVFVEPKTMLYEELIEWFGKTWQAAHPHTPTQTITKLHEVP